MSRAPARRGRPWQPIPVKKTLAHYPGALTAIGLVFSLAAHFWMAIALYDKPVGYVDPELLLATRAPVRVKRAQFDYIVPDAPRAGVGAQRRDAVSDLSRKLLADVQPGVDESPPMKVALRQLDDRMTPPRVDELAVDLPAFELTDQALAALTTGGPEDLRFSAESRRGAGDGSGSGGGSAEALRILRRTGIVTGQNPAPAAPAVADERLVADARLLEVPLEPAPIDFARIALRDTTALDFPQQLDRDFEYLVTRYQPRDYPKEPGFFKVDVEALRSLHKLEAMPKDVIFVIDVSGSIEQPWVEQITRGVRVSLPLLNDGDRFNIVLFSENPRLFDAESIQPVTAANIERANEFLTKAQSAGATDVNAAMSRLLVRDVKQERVYEIVLISDGKPTRGVVDTRQLINLITRDNDLRTSIYCVAVGTNPNLELLNFLSYRNKGFTLRVATFPQSAPAIRELVSRLRYPLIKDLRLDVAGRGIGEVYPRDLPNIHEGERFAVFGRFAQPGPFTMRITGTSAGRPVDFTFTRDLSDATLVDRGLARDWAFWKLHQLYSEIIRNGETDETRDEIRHLRREYDLKTLY